MSTRGKINRKHAPGTGDLESPENFHTKTDHGSSRNNGPGMERTLDRSQNMGREIDPDPELDRQDEQLDSDFDGEDDLGRDPDDDRNHPSVRGI